MRAIIFANGEISEPFTYPSNRQPEDILIAADGGYAHCQVFGLVPNVVIGDFDSLEPAQVPVLEASGVRIIRYPVRKDYTDLELAVQFTINLSPEEILVFGALGKRWDQTLANLLLPAAFQSVDIPIRLMDGLQEIMLIRPGQTLKLKGQPGDTISLIPLGGDAYGVATQGLEWPLKEETLHFGATRGVSNVLMDEIGSVYLEDGLLLVVAIHQSEQLLSMEGKDVT